MSEGMARAWQAHGEGMARAWRGHGEGMARAWLSRAFSCPFVPSFRRNHQFKVSGGPNRCAHVIQRPPFTPCSEGQLHSLRGFDFGPVHAPTIVPPTYAIEGQNSTVFDCSCTPPTETGFSRVRVSC